MDRARIHEGIGRVRFMDVLGRSEQSELSQMEAAELLGISERTFCRWRDRHREAGVVVLADRRLMGRAEPVIVPPAANGPREHANLWGFCVKKTRERHAVGEMNEDPSEPSCRGRLQTAMSCFGRKVTVVNVMVKRRDIDLVRYG